MEVATPEVLPHAVLLSRPDSQQSLPVMRVNDDFKARRKIILAEARELHSLGDSRRGNRRAAVRVKSIELIADGLKSSSRVTVSVLVVASARLCVLPGHCHAQGSSFAMFSSCFFHTISTKASVSV